MRKIISMAIMMMASIGSIVSCANNNSTAIKERENAISDSIMNETLTDKKILVVFFSHTGENYGVGNISEGNTHIIAKMIGEVTGGKLFEIVPEKDYPHDSYDAVVEIAKQEKARKARPAVKDDIAVEDYDVVFIGYPNWWGDMPMPVYTFLEKHDWRGKTIAPFCTHEGSGLSDTEDRIADACDGASVVKGLAVRGGMAQNQRGQALEDVKSWIESLR